MLWRGIFLNPSPLLFSLRYHFLILAGGFGGFHFSGRPSFQFFHRPVISFLSFSLLVFCKESLPSLLARYSFPLCISICRQFPFLFLGLFFLLPKGGKSKKIWPSRSLLDIMPKMHDACNGSCHTVLLPCDLVKRQTETLLPSI